MYVRRAVVSKGIGDDREDHDFSISYFILPVVFYVQFPIQSGKCVAEAYFSILVSLLSFFFFSC